MSTDGTSPKRAERPRWQDRIFRFTIGRGGTRRRTGRGFWSTETWVDSKGHSPVASLEPAGDGWVHLSFSLPHSTSEARFGAGLDAGGLLRWLVRQDAVLDDATLVAVIHDASRLLAKRATAAKAEIARRDATAKVTKAGGQPRARQEEAAEDDGARPEVSAS